MYVEYFPDEDESPKKTYNTNVTVVSLVYKDAYGIEVDPGDVINVLMAQDGECKLSKLPAITFDVDEYELYIPEDDFDKLLAWKPVS
jgi:hypothetical protein